MSKYYLKIVKENGKVKYQQLEKVNTVLYSGEWFTLYARVLSCSRFLKIGKLQVILFSNNHTGKVLIHPDYGDLIYERFSKKFFRSHYLPVNSKKIEKKISTHTIEPFFLT